MDLIGKYLGIWVNRDEIVEIFGLHPEDIFPDVAKDRPRRLIRWEYIRGYHPRAA